MFEKVYFGIMLGVMVVFFAIFEMIFDSERGMFTAGDYGNKVKAIIMYKWAIGLVFIVVNLVSMFVQFNFILSNLITLIFNLLSFGFLLYDNFFKQVKTEEYLIALQNESLHEVPLTDIFTYGENIAKYDLSSNDSTMLFKVIQGENGFLLGIQKKEKNILLIPKEKLSETEINFFCEQINIYWTQENTLPEIVKVFKNKALYNHRKEFVWIPTPKFNFLYSEKFKKRVRKTLKIVFYIVLFLLVVMITLDIFEILPFEKLLQWAHPK